MTTMFEKRFTEVERREIGHLLWSAFDSVAFDLIAEGCSISRATAIEVTLDANLVECSITDGVGSPEEKAQYRALMERFRKLSPGQQKAAARLVTFRSPSYCR